MGSPVGSAGLFYFVLMILLATSFPLDNAASTVPDKAIEISSMFMTPEAFFIMGLIGAIIASVIIGLIVTIFTQKKNPEPAF